MKIDELMQSQVLSCHQNANLEAIAQLMWNNDCDSIPVVDDNDRPIAMITDCDIAMGSALNYQPLCDITAQQVHGNSELLSCSAEDNLQVALSIIHAGQVRRLPVVDDEGS